LTGQHPYVYLDGIWLKRNWGGDYQNVSILVAIAVDQDGFREIIGAAEGSKEDKASWLNFLRYLKERGLTGTQLFVGDKCLGLFETLAEVFPPSQVSTLCGPLLP
jgi:putative transposase